MNVSTLKPRRLGSSMLIAAAIALGATVPALAADTVTQGITAGTRSASVANLGLAATAYSHAQHNSTGSMTLTADDSTGSNAGWNVTIMSSAFVWTAGTGGASSGTDIPASDFALTSDSVATPTAGQGVDPTGGPTAGVTGALSAAKKVLAAQTSFGNGTYTQALGVALTVPAESAAGTYTGTLTTSISAAP